MKHRPFLFMLVAAALSYGAVVASAPAFAQPYNNEPEDSLPTPGTPPSAQNGSDPEDTRPPPQSRQVAKLIAQRQKLIDRCERRFNRGKDLENIQAQLLQNERKLRRFGASPITPAPSYCSEATES